VFLSSSTKTRVEVWENEKCRGNTSLRCFHSFFEFSQTFTNVSITRFQSGKTYCASFCASLALLAGSGDNEGCNCGKKGGVNGGLLIRCARMSFGWYIFTRASMIFFRHFTVKKTKFPLPAESPSCLYIQWAAYMDAICKECLRKKCVFAPKVFVYTVGK